MPTVNSLAANVQQMKTLNTKYYEYATNI
jgi:hypothetical protein